jgi:hypothetical protein
LLRWALGLATAVSAAASGPSGVAQGEPAKHAPTATTVSAVSDGRLVVHLIVPLCDNDQIDCGSTRAGDPTDLEHNLYWGAVFGQKRFFGRKASTYTKVSTEGADGDRLERVTFEKKVAGKPWGIAGDVDLFVVMDAYRGDAIDRALAAFYREAERGGSLGPGRVDLVGWAGHNRMMDGTKPPALANAEERSPIPSFVLACRSRSYFEGPLTERGSTPIALTRDLMAPEGYVVDAVVDGFAANESRAAVRKRAVTAYAKFQRIEEKAAGSIFAKLDD